MPTRPRSYTATVAFLLVALGAAAQDDTSVTHLTDRNGERKPLNTVVPIYPEKARRQRLEGEVQVCFHVDRQGKTSRVRVRNSTDRVFEKSAVLAARASSFAPVPPGQPASGIKTCRTFRFRLLPVAIEPAE